MHSPAPARLFAGTSGWAYPTWKPGFYPEGTPAKKFLSFYASKLNSVEVNYTFSKLPTPAIVAGWIALAQAAGPGFRFSLKAPQRITHFSRLRDCEPHIKAFYESIAPIREAGMLGLILYQLPPSFKANHERLRDFLASPSLHASDAPPIAFEFRHPSWFCDESNALLSGHGAAFCIADTDTLATPEVHCAPHHTCFRLRRDGGYKPRELKAFAERFRLLAETRDVYVYFRHQDEPTGALNAVAFRRAAAAATKRAGK